MTTKPEIALDLPPIKQGDMIPLASAFYRAAEAMVEQGYKPEMVFRGLLLAGTHLAKDMGGNQGALGELAIFERMIHRYVAEAAGEETWHLAN